jgi:hypothetical protein
MQCSLSRFFFTPLATLNRGRADASTGNKYEQRASGSQTQRQYSQQGYEQRASGSQTQRQYSQQGYERRASGC